MKLDPNNDVYPGDLGILNARKHKWAKGTKKGYGFKIASYGILAAGLVVIISVAVITRYNSCSEHARSHGSGPSAASAFSGQYDNKTQNKHQRQKTDQDVEDPGPASEKAADLIPYSAKK